MTRIEEDIQLLIKIVKKDTEIKNKKKLLENAPPKIEEIDRKINQMSDQLAQNKEKLDRISKEKRSLERDVDAYNEKIRNEKLKQQSVKSNKEFRAMNAEIEYLQKLIDRDESRILEIMEESEKRRNEINQFSNSVEKEIRTLEKKKEELERLIKESKEDLMVLQDEKARIMPHLSDRIRKKYLRILEVKGDSGVANLVDDVCHGCYSKVPPQKAYEVRKNDRIITCETCGRILVYYPESKDVEGN